MQRKLQLAWVALVLCGTMCEGRCGPQKHRVTIRPEPHSVQQAEQHQRRLSAYVLVMLDWIDGTVIGLSPSQKNRLSALCAANVNDGVKWIEQSELWAQSRNPDNFRAIFPVRFTLPVGPAEQLDLLLSCNPAREFDKQLEAILTPQQLEPLKKTYEERRGFQTSCMVGQVVNIFDAELFLSTDQRQHFRQSISDRIHAIAGRCASLTPLQKYYPQQSLYSEITHTSLTTVLTETQKFRAQTIETSGKASGSNSYCRATGVRSSLMEFHSSKMDRWQQDLKVVKTEYQELLAQIFAVRMEYQRRRCAIPDEMLVELSAVGQSISDEFLADWEFAAQQEIDSREPRGRKIRGESVFGFRLPAMEHAKIDHHPDWEIVIGRISTETGCSVDLRLKSRREDDAMAILGLLDKELWLQPRQRSTLKDLIYNVTPSGGFVPSIDNFTVEVSMLLVPLLKIDEEKLTFLTANQIVVWKGLRSYFQIVDGGQGDRTRRTGYRGAPTANLVSPVRKFSVPIEILQ